MSTVDLWLSINDNTGSELALSIPLEKCQQLAVNPLKWLRFLGYLIYGNEGYLSTSHAGPDIGNYTTGVEPRAYYFISEGQPHFADMKAMSDRTSDGSDLSDFGQADSDFRDKIVARDVTCVSTGEIAGLCEACHIIPHSKGSNYMNILSRDRGPANIQDGLDGIDDTQNGLLLWSPIHVLFGFGAMVPLKTPDLGLTVNDIPFNPSRQTNEPSSTSRLTWHHIVDSDLGKLMPAIVPNNTDLRTPEDTSNWPPAFLCNSFYASAIMKAWSPPSFKESIWLKAKDVYYPAIDSELGETSVPPQPIARERRRQARNEKKATGVHAKKIKLHSMMDAIMGIRMLAGQHGTKQQQTEDSAYSHNKVKAWLQSSDLEDNSEVVTESE